MEYPACQPLDVNFKRVMIGGGDLGEAVCMVKAGTCVLLALFSNMWVYLLTEIFQAALPAYNIRVSVKC